MKHYTYSSFISKCVLYINATRCYGKYQHIISQQPGVAYIVIYYKNKGDWL